jgi:hypothetical protein
MILIVLVTMSISAISLILYTNYLSASEQKGTKRINTINTKKQFVERSPNISFESQDHKMLA